MSLSIPHWCTWQSSSSPPPSPTGNLCQSVSPTVYMPEILLSSPIPHWGHVSLRVPHCVHGRDPLLSHHPLRICNIKHPSLHTLLESSSSQGFSFLHSILKIALEMPTRTKSLCEGKRSIKVAHLQGCTF